MFLTLKPLAQIPTNISPERFAALSGQRLESIEDKPDDRVADTRHPQDTFLSLSTHKNCQPYITQRYTVMEY